MIEVHWTILLLMFMIGAVFAVAVMGMMMMASDADDLSEQIYRREAGVDLYD